MKAFSIYGPPGTGKTTEVIDRIARAIKGGSSQSSLFFMSFTKAAAQEATQRVGLLKSDNFCTIHSMCYRLTRANRGSVIDYRKLVELSDITGVRFAMRANEYDEIADGDAYLQIISKATNLLVPVEEAYEMSDRPGTFDEFIMVANTYSEWKKAYGYIDFDDMLVRALGKGVKFSAERLYIDEAQDLTPLQWQVVHRLIELSKPEEVHIAGDDDQCIYEYGGADPHGMDAFEEKYGASRKVLEQSWRVPVSVHSLADYVIKRVSRRVDKVYKPKEEPGCVSFGVDVCTSGVTHGEDVMILGRTHSVLQDVEQHLKDMRVPYVKSGGVSLFNNRYAMSIRGVLKAHRGEPLKDEEYNALLKVADPFTKAAIQTGNNSALKGRHWKDVLDIPYSLLSYYEDVDVEQEPTIRLSTIHAAKGKEADRIILLTQQTPRIQEAMSNRAGVDNEHRCMYVGITRAKRQLDIIIDDEGYPI